MDFIVILSNTGKDSNFTRFRDEIDKFILTEKDETIKEFCEVMRQLTLLVIIFQIIFFKKIKASITQILFFHLRYKIYERNF